jgi:hypothetical protein
MTGVFCIWGFQVEGTDPCAKEESAKEDEKKWLDSRTSIGPNMDIIRTPTSLPAAARTLVEECLP